MITMKELNPKGYILGPETKTNLEILHGRINVVRNYYGKPMIVTSGVRSFEDQKALIEEKKSKATKSKHLTAQAVDILDRDCELHYWLKDKSDLSERVMSSIQEENPKEREHTLMKIVSRDPNLIGQATLIYALSLLWFEVRQGPWQHFQIVPPASGKRWFYP